MDYKTILKYSSEARAVYGSGPGTPPRSTAQFDVVPVLEFRASSESFQAALYKDPTSGKYRIAVAGTDDLTGDLAADGSLMFQNLFVKASNYASSWHPEMSDALNFTFEALKHIRNDLVKRGNENPSLDDIRSAVDVTGHSLGGALSELIHSFYGLNGANIDGPGVKALTEFPEFAAMRAKVRETFPELQDKYVTEPGGFVANAFSIVGMAGTHFEETSFQATPNARLTFPTAIGAMFTAPLTGPAGIVGGLGMAGADMAEHHPMSAIVQLAERQQGLTPATQLPAVDFGALIHAPQLEMYRADMSSATEYGRALTWLAEKRQSNVMAGLSPTGVQVAHRVPVPYYGRI